VRNGLADQYWSGQCEQYKAEDTKLGRFVALKFLPDDVAKNHQALERFAASSLCICSQSPKHLHHHEIDEQDAGPSSRWNISTGKPETSHLRRPIDTEQLLNCHRKSPMASDGRLTPRESSTATSSRQTSFITKRGQAKLLASLV